MRLEIALWRADVHPVAGVAIAIHRFMALYQSWIHISRRRHEAVGRDVRQHPRINHLHAGKHRLLPCRWYVCRWTTIDEAHTIVGIDYHRAIGTRVRIGSEHHGHQRLALTVPVP